MWDEMRGHDPRPNEEEVAWLNIDLKETLMKGIALAVVALAVGAIADLNGERDQAPVMTTSAGPP